MARKATAGFSTHHLRTVIGGVATDAESAALVIRAMADAAHERAALFVDLAKQQDRAGQEGEAGDTSAEAYYQASLGDALERTARDLEREFGLR